MYSFGVVLWEIVTQDKPRRGQLRTTRVPAECPQEIEDLITACLSITPEERPTARQAFAAISLCIQAAPERANTSPLP